MSSYTPVSKDSDSGFGLNDDDFNYKEIKRKLIALQELLDSKYEKLGEGSFRACYEYSPTQVIKCPTHREVYGTSDNSVYCNLVEYHVYKEYSRKRIMPKTNLIWMMGIPLVVMNKIDMHDMEPSDYDKFEEKLDKYGISLADGYYQLGKNANGTILCADMGNEDDLLNISVRANIEKKVGEIYKNIEKPLKKISKKKEKQLELLLS